MPGQAVAIDLALLLRRDVALEPDEAALRRQPLAQFGGVEIGQLGGEQLDRFVDVDEPARLGESDGTRTSVARTSPLRSRMSGRAVATASLEPPRCAARPSGTTPQHHQPQRDDA